MSDYQYFRIMLACYFDANRVYVGQKNNIKTDEIGSYLKFALNELGGLAAVW